jgi:hypothetical protein
LAQQFSAASDPYRACGGLHKGFVRSEKLISGHENAYDQQSGDTR